ncbi:hypothetical protein F2P81_003123 [Scophthalmus maximus]|uniref:Uncharacterized protein n=1 Tax=Scophthalmus maximus TaxID=52904 RepID=A0A6A4TFF1_SCOMX|nr:hypothetical protein F2P81_003123 [Scophthalmus maximus]
MPQSCCLSKTSPRPPSFELQQKHASRARTAITVLQLSIYGRALEASGRAPCEISRAPPPLSPAEDSKTFNSDIFRVLCSPETAVIVTGPLFDRTAARRKWFWANGCIKCTTLTLEVGARILCG